jgi:hypothetical protein
MLREAACPECFNDLEDGFIFVEAFNKQCIYAYLALLIEPPSCVFHLEVVKFTHNILKHLYVDWDLLKSILKKNGVNKIMITKEGLLSENATYCKFLRKFGLPAPSQIMIAAYEI